MQGFLYKYSKLYSGKMPELIEGDIFRIIVPLDDGYSADSGSATTQSATQTTQCNPLLTEQDLKIVEILRKSSLVPKRNIYRTKHGY